MSRFFDQSECRHPWCPGTPARVQQHHVVYRQEVEREGGDTGDARNALALCVTCHARHHGRQPGRVVELVVLRDENIEYAVDLLGAGRAYNYLRRRYAGSDPRVEALIA